MKKKSHCITKGCGGFKLKDDERCLSCVHKRYNSYWSRNQVYCGRQIRPITLDTLDKSSYSLTGE